MKKPLSSAIRVLLVDDHPIVLSGCENALAIRGIATIGRTSFPEEATRLYRHLQPDALVLDIKFGGASTGFDLAREILADFPLAKIVFWSQCDQESVIREAYRLGALAYVTKLATPDELVAGIVSANAGTTYLQPAVAEQFAHRVLLGKRSPQEVLNARELCVFKHMAQGLTNHEIATELQLAVRTISTVSQSVKEKLGAQRSADITRMAVRHGILDP